MEILVVLSIIIILASIAYPVIMRAKKIAYKAEALKKMQGFTTAANTYIKDNAGILPAENVTGGNTWALTGASTPEADKAWFNSLPKLMSVPSARDYANGNPPASAFYQKGSIFFLPGVDYPNSAMMSKPLFAIAMNTKIHRREDVNGVMVKEEVLMATIKLPSRTILFMEQGIPGEKKAHSTITQGDYDGSPKGSAKSFVERYNGIGLISFFDGSVIETTGKSLLDNDGRITWDASNESGIFWTADPKTDPN